MAPQYHLWLIESALCNLALNKRDLLAEKLKTEAFIREGYNGDPHSYEQVCAYIQEEFEKKVRQGVANWQTSLTARLR